MIDVDALTWQGGFLAVAAGLLIALVTTPSGCPGQCSCCRCS
jgi:hypothetical protein